MHIFTIILLPIISLLLLSCHTDHHESDQIININISDLDYDILASNEHINTQCLAWSPPEMLWQTSGDLDESLLIKRSLSSIQAEQWSLKDIYAEGCTLWQQQLLLLSWRSYQLFIYDPNTGDLVRQLPIATEGWGIAASDSTILYSDGSATLRWIDQQSLHSIDERPIRIDREQVIYALNTPVFQLNELEWVEEFLFANIYPTHKIAVIRPNQGQVIAWLDLSELKFNEEVEGGVSNGIAYDIHQGTIWLTGKKWKNLYGIKSEPLLQRLRLSDR